MNRKFKTGDWVIIKTGQLKGKVATIDQVLVLPELDRSLYVVKWPDPKNIEHSYLCAKNRYISTQLEKTELRANIGDNVYITEPTLYGRSAIITKLHPKCLYSPKSDTPIGYTYMYTLRYVDPNTKETTTSVFDHWQFSHTKPKSLAIQMAEFRPQDSVSQKTPHKSEVLKELRKLVHGDKEPSKEIVDYNKKVVDNVVIMKRRISWNEICFQYVEAFCQRHGYIAERDAWVGGDVGTTICINDMYIGMDEIRYDVDNDIPIEQFEKWYWKSLEVYELTNEKWLNYPSFCKGAPDPWPEEKLKKVREGAKKIAQMKKELDDYITEVKNSGRNPLF